MPRVLLGTWEQGLVASLPSALAAVIRPLLGLGRVPGIGTLGAGVGLLLGRLPAGGDRGPAGGGLVPAASSAVEEDVGR
jgi:hypothetical protein